MTAEADSADVLQRGIYFRSGLAPPPHWGLLLLNVSAGTKPSRAAAALAAVWAMLEELREGIVRDLGPDPGGHDVVRVPGGDLAALLGIGARLFDGAAHVPALVAQDLRPWPLTPLGSKPFPRIERVPEADRRPGEADIAIQLTAAGAIGVARAAVETWKLIVDEQLPLEVVALHTGFGRDDGRSWIDFHDGVNNMSVVERREAITVTVADPPWMQGGTYVAFLRLVVDLAAWRALPRAAQELVVGRTKLAGCPIESATAQPDGTLSIRPALPCPVPAGAPADAVAAYRNPGRSDSALTEASHIHRSNLNRGAPDTDANNRIYRQGYEFFDRIGPQGPAVGLNFVSFQRTLKRLQDILRTPQWQGGTNFGGPDPAEPRALDITLMRLVAGGFYAAPPIAQPFPGAELLGA